MKLLIIGGLALISAAAVASPVWYNGNNDDVNGFAAISGPNGFGSEWVEYEDFTWNSASNAGSIMATMIGTSNFTQVKWEVRQGMDFGTNNAGVLVASGTSNVTTSLVGAWVPSPSFNVYNVTGDISSVALTNGGSYFLGMAIVSTGQSFIGGVTSTSGAGSIGSPVNNDNGFGINGSGAFASAGMDLSMGIGTASVPEPASFAVLGLGALALVRRKRKG